MRIEFWKLNIMRRLDWYQKLFYHTKYCSEYDAPNFLSPSKKCLFPHRKCYRMRGDHQLISNWIRLQYWRAINTSPTLGLIEEPFTHINSYWLEVCIHGITYNINCQRAEQHRQYIATNKRELFRFKSYYRWQNFFSFRNGHGCEYRE